MNSSPDVDPPQEDTGEKKEQASADSALTTQALSTDIETPEQVADSPRTPQPSPDAVLRAVGIRRSFDIGERSLEILHGVNLELRQGELVALVGSSGAGKSTMLHVLGLLDRPDEGHVWVQDVDAWELSNNARAGLRNQRIGFVFQMYHLLPELTAIENVMLPAMIAESRIGFSSKRKEYVERAEGMLERFGLQSRMKHRPAQLSGGERQRVAMARALFQDPAILLADEPTGNLDSATGEKVLELLLQEQQRRELSMILVTHDLRLAKRCKRVLVMEDGQIQADSTVPIPT